MTAADFKQRLKTGELAGWYIFSGEEDYLKRYYRKELYKRIIEDETFATFNHTLFEGDEFDAAALGEALYAPPMMADFKLIEWRGANLDALSEGKISAIEKLFEAKDSYPYAIFAITATEEGFDRGSEKKPSKLYKRLASIFEILAFDKSTDAQLLSWLKKHFDAEGVGVDAPTLSAMLFRVGHSMQQLNEEVTKLSSYAKANGLSQITAKEIEEICSSTAESDAFAISNAIIEKNSEKAFLALTEMKRARIDAQVIIGQLSKVYSDLTSISLLMDEGKDSGDIEEIMKFHPYRLKRYMGAAKKLGTKRLAAALESLLKTDAASKAGGISGYKAIEIFITQNI